jgi:hypothetical protein
LDDDLSYSRLVTCTEECVSKSILAWPKATKISIVWCYGVSSAGTKWPLTKLRIPGRRRVLSLRWPTSPSAGRCCHLAVNCKNARPDRTLGHKRRCKGSSVRFRIASDSGRIVAARKSAASCQVSTARGWQGESPRRRWSVQPCVLPVGAVHMTAGHNALRGSGPGQFPAFDNAVAPLRPAK